MTDPNPEDVTSFAAEEDENPDDLAGEPVDDGLDLDLDLFYEEE